MKKNKQNGQAPNNSKGLAPVEIETMAATRGKVRTHYTLEDQAAAEAAAGKLDKNQVFTRVSSALCPVHFDEEPLKSSLQPLVSSGIMSVEVMQATISRARAEFLQVHAAEIAAAESMDFDEIIAKIQAVPGLYSQLLQVCNVEDFRETDYTQGGSVLIYRAAQSFDKDGNPRFEECSLSKEVDGRTFSVPLYCERRPTTSSNIVAALRYHQSFLDARRRMEFAIAKHRAALHDVEVAATKAKESGFTLSQIEGILKKVFA